MELSFMTKVVATNLAWIILALKEIPLCTGAVVWREAKCGFHSNFCRPGFLVIAALYVSIIRTYCNPQKMIHSATSG